LNNIKILFEDDDIVVAVKPAGVLSQEGEAPNMVDLLKERVGGYIAAVHRLDKMTGGVMVYAKNQKSAARLSKSIAQRSFFKTYLAVVKGSPDDSGEWEDLLFRDAKRNKSFVVTRVRRGVKRAHLTFKTIERCGEFSLVEIKPTTGRTHQIRVQFSHRKMPLLGDGKYGGASNKCSLALWCRQIELIHPKFGEKMIFSVSPNDKFPWNMFRKINAIE
jgi:23S rRNA pseudouridine1911/1915/1917 synthase